MTSLFFLSLMNGAAWGGSEELWFRTARHAAASGYKVACAFYYWKEKEEKVEALRKAGCQIYLLPNKGRSKRNLAERLQYKISKWKVKRMISSFPYQQYNLFVVNLGGYEIHMPAWEKVFHRLPKYVLLFHNYSETEVFKPAKAERMRQWMNNASANLFAAKRIKEVLEEKLDITIPYPDVFINPITIIPPTMPPPYPQLREPYFFAMLAELDVNRKAQDNLLKALSLPRWKGRPWKLFLYGRGNDKEMLESMIIHLGLTGKVELKGYVTNVKDVLQQVHLVLQITHRDAMPLTVVEAMAMGRPVVVSRIGDMPCWVKEGRNGWISNNASVEEIDAVMEKAWQQKKQWPGAGEQSFILFKEKFPASPEERLLQQLHQAFI